LGSGDKRYVSTTETTTLQKMQTNKKTPGTANWWKDGAVYHSPPRKKREPKGEEGRKHKQKRNGPTTSWLKAMKRGGSHTEKGRNRITPEA